MKLALLCFLLHQLNTLYLDMHVCHGRKLLVFNENKSLNLYPSSHTEVKGRDETKPGRSVNTYMLCTYVTGGFNGRHEFLMTRSTTVIPSAWIRDELSKHSLHSLNPNTILTHNAPTLDCTYQCAQIPRSGRTKHIIRKDQRLDGSLMSPISITYTWPP